DELLGRRLLGLDDGHALAHDPLHAKEADAELALDELAHRAHPAVAEVIDVVRRALSVVQLDDAADDLHEVLVGEGARGHGLVEAQLSSQLAAADLREVVAADVGEERWHETTRVGARGG